MEKSTTVHEIKTLILSRLPVILMETVEEERVEALLRLISSMLGLTLFDWSVTQGLRRDGVRTAIHGTTDPSLMLKHVAGLNIDALFLLRDFIGYVEKPEINRLFREICDQFSGKKSTIVLTGSDISLSKDLSYWAVPYKLSLPDEEELRNGLREILKSLRAENAFEIDLDPGGLSELVRALRGLTLKQVRQTVAYAVLEDGRLTREDILEILNRKAEAVREQGLLEFYPAGGNSYELGGFGNLRHWLQRARMGFTEQARRLNLAPPKGILLVGVQGCGKSLAAKFVAREWRLPLLKMDAGRLFDKYIGESEKNFEKATRQAESLAPAVLWIDELEKAFPSAGGSNADGGLSWRLLGSFLTWLQEKKEPVFVVATSNDLSALPPELLRKGRFDEIFFVDLPDDAERIQILQIHLEIRKQNPKEFDLPRLADACRGFSGAEIEQAIISGLYRTLHQDQKLDTEAVLREFSATIPLSVSRKEDIDSLREWAQGRFVSVR